MKTAISLLTVELALIVTSAAAHAEPHTYYLIPPAEYDRPYKGELVVQIARDEDHVRELCPRAVFSPRTGALGCMKTRTEDVYCRIVMAPDDVIKAAGFPPELVKRHEIGHCNGWPADHKGARAWQDWAKTETEGSPGMAAALFDGAVRQTVAKVAYTLGHKADRFIAAAKGIGLTPESQVTPEILTDPATAVPLARAAGIGTNLTDEQWKEAHAVAVYASRARQPNPGQATPQPQQAQPTAARATTDVVCAVVLNTPDGFLAVRERPGTQFRMTDKLRPGQAVNISSEDCDWHSNGKVTCNKWIMVSGGDRTPASGWVRSKYLRPYPDC